MANVKIADLPAAGAVGTSVVPVMNAAGTATNAVTLASIAALGGGAPAAHKASHATGGADALTAADIGAASSSHTHAAGDISGLSTVATSGSYADLSNKPTIPTLGSIWARS